MKLGAFNTLTIDDDNRLYAFSRQLGNEEVIVVINRSDKVVLFSDQVLLTKKYKNLLTNLQVGTQVKVNPMDLVVLGNK